MAKGRRTRRSRASGGTRTPHTTAHSGVGPKLASAEQNLSTTLSSDGTMGDKPSQGEPTTSISVEEQVDALMAAPAPSENSELPLVPRARIAMPGAPAAAAPAAVANPKADAAALDELERHLYAHRYARIGITSYRESIDPSASTKDSGETLAILEQEDQELLCSVETGQLLERLDAQGNLLSDMRRAQVRILKRERNRLINVASEEQAAFSRLTSEATVVWRKAKAASDWSSFAPYLDRIVRAMRAIAHHRDASQDPYDVWLDEFEHGRDRSFYDSFFAQVKDVVVPLVSEVGSSRHQPSRRPIEGRYDMRRQWALAHDLMGLIGLDSDKVFLTTTEHPFSDALTSHYAVVATHIYEDDLSSNVFTMLHEGGHALYETGVDAALDYTSLKGGTSMGMHEAQSRFFENYIGHAEAYVPTLIAILRRHFPGQFGRVTARQFYLATNRAVPGTIRTSADELTYPLHIIVRYEIEELLMSGEAKASDVPGLWADKYRTYLGVSVPDDARGALQDIHWSQGALGYFPTYALGSAIGAQLKAAMLSGGMDFDAVLSSGNLSPICEWLRERIWRHGRIFDSEEMIKKACGSPFDPSHYTSYLKEKYRSMYGL